MRLVGEVQPEALTRGKPLRVGTALGRNGRWPSTGKTSIGKHARCHPLNPVDSTDYSVLIPSEQIDFFDYKKNC